RSATVSDRVPFLTPLLKSPLQPQCGFSIHLCPFKILPAIGIPNTHFKIAKGRLSDRNYLARIARFLRASKGTLMCPQSSLVVLSSTHSVPPLSFFAKNPGAPSLPLERHL